MRLRAALATLLLLYASGAAGARTAPDAVCLLRSGDAAAKCVRRYVSAVGRCRSGTDAACEPALRGGSRLGGFRAAIEAPTRRACSEESAGRLTFSLGVDDLVFRDAQACEAWAEDFVATASVPDASALSSAARSCQRRVVRQLRTLHETIARAYGPGCYAVEAAGGRCDRAGRDERVGSTVSASEARILHACGAHFDELGLGRGPTTQARVAWLVARVADMARHLAQRVYPPLLPPAGLFGPHPVGVRTLELADPSRPRPVEPRLLRTEVYYPADPGAVAGVPRDHLVEEGADLGETPTYRDVSRATGAFPLVVYSHFGGGRRYESAFRLAHLASHGFVVASPDHDDSPNGVFDDAQFENRPLDVSFLVDELLAFASEPGHFLEGAIDPARIGATGGSFGGYTVTALAVGAFFRGTFTDPRVKAILPIDAPVGAEDDHFAADAPAIFSTIVVPTLALGGDSLTSVPFEAGNQALFEALVPGPPVMAYGTLHGAAHGSFIDSCQFLGSPRCYAFLMPSRYAARIVGYLAVSFFEGVLNGDAEALARLDPAALAVIDDLAVQSK